MALRNLAVKMRIPASAGPRLLSAPRVLPAAGSRALPFSSSSKSPIKVARSWYLLQREHYDDLTKELRNLSRLVLWTEKFDRFLRRVYLVGTPLAAGCVVLEWNDYRKASEAARK
ncbi:uncharacterized protein LOC124686985 [Lolium rigidum]|uniref:uncharacterized protein LOC124686985 n=1 Tax=Lolium rigidum TaxID=89674 RepID=UPI001F5CE457|nr:uncharacterized protein LOC124686985 [Lolium rigidum]